MKPLPRILHLAKISFKNKGETKTFRHRKAERIHCQQTHTIRMEKYYQREICISTKKLRSLEWNYVSKYKEFLYHLNLVKNNS